MHPPGSKMERIAMRIVGAKDKNLEIVECIHKTPIK
jgi:hypothetical protein